MDNSFTTLPLKQDIIANLQRLNYITMTPIQQKSLPYSLNNKDIIAQAQTGSGKTIAFSLVVLNKLDVQKFRIQSLVLAPTRELAYQIAQEMKLLAKFTHNIKITILSGGVPYKPQVHSLSHQAHIIIGTPGRVLKHLQEKSFDPKDITTLVLDEADRMLDMGFYDDITTIIDFLPTNRQTLLFSATYPENIEILSKKILKDPQLIKIENQLSSTDIVQHFYEVNLYDKTNVVLDMLNKLQPQSTIIFCNTKIKCDQIADELEQRDIPVVVLHSDFDQKERLETIILFANKSYPVLVATDVASRGLDIKDVDLVINYELPFDTEVYTHRIGRTARAGQKGIAMSLVDEDTIELYQQLDTTYPLEQYELQSSLDFKLIPKYQTLFINGGKKHKIRAGDILGALTAGLGLHKDDIGKIDILDFVSYVAIISSKAEQTQKTLSNSRIKGKYFKIYLL